MLKFHCTLIHLLQYSMTHLQFLYIFKFSLLNEYSIKCITITFDHLISAVFLWFLNNKGF